MNTTTKEVGIDSSFITADKTALPAILEFRNKKITAAPRNLIGIGLIAGGLAVIGVIAFEIITGAAALAVAAVTGAGLLYGVRALKTFDPYIRQKWKNERLKLMMAEAQQNGIYQLDNEVLRQTQKLADARAARDKMGAKVENLRTHLPKDIPENAEERKEMLAVINRMKMAYEQAVENVDRMAEQVAEFEREVERHKRKHHFAKDVGELIDAMSTNTAAEKLEQMLSMESLRSISNNFDTSLISIENLVRDNAVSAD